MLIITILNIFVTDIFKINRKKFAFKVFSYAFLCLIDKNKKIIMLSYNLQNMLISFILLIFNYSTLCY